MFDIGFWELVLIAGIALIVIGPERLPKAANTVGRWVGQARRLARGLQAQVREELAREERNMNAALRVADEVPEVKAVEEEKEDKQAEPEIGKRP